MANFVVTTSNDIVDANDGETSLREALTLANSLGGADTITFDAALSGETITLSGTELVLSSDVTIDGDIDGDDIADITISGDDASRVLRAESGTSTLHALTITGGNVVVFGDGGGLLVEQSATVDLTNSTLSRNTAREGGGVYNSGMLSVTDSTLSGNYAWYGGGVYNSGTISVSNSALSGNRAGYGGGIHNEGTAVLTDSTLNGNRSDGAGGGVYNTGTIVITNSTVNGNVQLGGGTLVAGGGGVYNRGTASLTNSTLSGNTGSTGGGVKNFGTVTLTNITLSGNTARSDGGGLYNEWFGTAEITNSTITGNYAYGSGGGIYQAASDTISTTLTNSIVLGNATYDNYSYNTEISDRSAYPNSFGVSAVLITNSLTGLGDETVQQVFEDGGVLADNGGPVQTMALRSNAANPALDAGDDSAAPLTDATGAGRVDIAGVDNNGGNISDLGAVELPAIELRNLIVTTATDVVDAADGELSLREALALANSEAGGDLITFAETLSGETITLAGSELVLSSDLTIDGDIDGDGAADITISGGDASRVFNIQGGGANLNALTITDGKDGAISVRSVAADLVLTNSTLSGNSGSTRNGVIYTSGNVTVINSLLAGNAGTAIYVDAYQTYRATVKVINSTFSGTDGIPGRAFQLYFGDLSVINSTISGFSDGAFRNKYFTADVTLTNTIMLGNGSDSLEGERGAFESINSLTGAGGETAADVFASVGPGGGGVLADNGGPVQTIALLNDAQNPALDAGDDAAAPATDARGAGRADNAKTANNGGNISDLGAFELQLSTQVGGSGPDVIFGNDRNNDLSGSAGADEIYGLDGNDFLRGGPDEDILDGGAGVDTVLYDHSAAGVTIVLIADGDGVQAAFGGDAEGDVLRGFERVVGSDFSDDLTGDAADNELRGEGGDDSLFGAAGEDTLRGGNGKDFIEGGDDADLILGNNGADTLFGQAGDDEIRGGGGKDLLSGGAGKDLLRGDGGDDVFFFQDVSDSTRADPDTIRGMDGVGVAGGDVIDLHAVDASSALGGNQDFIWLGEQALSGGLSFVASALWVENDGIDTMLYGTVDTDILIDFAVRIEDGAGIDAADYILSDFLI